MRKIGIGQDRWLRNINEFVKYRETMGSLFLHDVVAFRSEDDNLELLRLSDGSKSKKIKQ
jgi:hypothetical protein